MNFLFRKKEVFSCNLDQWRRVVWRSINFLQHKTSKEIFFVVK
jgi:hypothetical protein